ncbi:MAG: radical SAM family heme chaperone HemW [Proteiniphilum sp.]|nr:radical SAM family heme chaperone HemW [Proteiniphilum sp.]
MAGIYIHVPYCKTRCIYCNFYKETDEGNIDAFVKALCSEFVLRKNETTDTIKTIYFGGGTPSRLSINHFKEIFNYIFQNYNIDADAEITIEANPDDLSKEYVDMLRNDLPINRLSIGIQSFDDDELKFLSRRHNGQQAIDAVKYCQQVGFNNISIDLIYGLPNQTLELWMTNLQKAFELNVQHMSAYHLIYEKDTKLYNLLERGRVVPIVDDMSTAMFSMLIEQMSQNGFEHYEISNFAKDELYSKHNTSYWLDQKYIGFGPSAHSYDGSSRTWNIASLGKYILAMQEGQLPQEGETLSSSEQYNEFILTKLGMMRGINIDVMKSRFGQERVEYCLQLAKKYIDEGLLVHENNKLRLTNKGIFISDGIMSGLMWIE